ncbi:hypothetical protein GGI11_006987 [Coemansia sp. RSA 2049]|nr:hypothetical protein GGI11_006987 [Coemansia sp. RSA 2049]
MLEEFVQRDYAIVFFVHQDFSRLLEFRKACDEAAWLLVSRNLTSFTCTRREYTKILREKYEIEHEQGVAFFKSDNLVSVLNGFAIKDFTDMLNKFDPLKPFAGKGSGNTTNGADEYDVYVKEGKCVLFFTNGTIDSVHRLVFEGYPLMSYVEYLGIPRYAVVYGDAYDRMSKAQNIASPTGVALVDELGVACSFGLRDECFLRDYIDLMFGDPGGQSQQPTMIRQAITLVDNSNAGDGDGGWKGSIESITIHPLAIPPSRSAMEIEQRENDETIPMPPSINRSLSARLFSGLLPRRSTAK